MTTTLARKLARTESVCEQIAAFELKFSFDDAVVRVLLFEFFVFVDSTLLLSCLMLVIPPDQWLGYVCIQREAQDLLIDEKDSESERNIN